MKHRLYVLLMIVLPLFVGSGALCELIRYFLGQRNTSDLLFMVLLAMAGLGSGIAKLWELTGKAEK